MAESTKYTPINNGTLPSEFNFTNIFTFRTKRSRTFAYIFVAVFVAFTVFLAFNPSQNPSSPWFSNIFTGSSFRISSSSTGLQPNTPTVKNNQTTSSPPFLPASSSTNQTTPFQETVKNGNNSYPPVVRNQTDLKPNQRTTSSPPVQSVSNQNNQTTPLQKTVTNASSNGTKSSSEFGDLVKKLVNCDLFDGEWVKDESYPLYKPGSCSLIDEQFNCFNNGRPDNAYQMLKWKPKSCTLPRLDGSHMLQLLRGKRLVFVGDSLNRNMWESLVCILRNSVKDQSKVYEASGRHHFRSEPSYSFVFKDYNCTVEFFVAPFIVRESVTKDKNGEKKETLRLDLIGTSADQYKTADIVVFNTGHWWTHEKTAKGKDYYQEGSHVYNELNVLEAFRKAITTWGRWVDANVNPSKTLVFFRGYSASHFRGGQWNSGGQCDNEVEPIKNTTYLSPYPDKMKVLEKVLRNMKTRVSYLNITRLTDFRKDGHPSIYRKQHYSEQEKRHSPLHFQDCSHWCLPGVPDSWNEILYAELLAKQYQNQKN
ncbi:putative PMR5 domain, PC-Esterase [Helianthus annuus]|nr:putative PMR5 domain, PC-Esterase [Helianthus annuus]KAJ0529401.1 putative PMR5 domain, PC-Esterase [Helianthus annuus]KAJ0696287.1 putative PMR5 domain, PC-Esterase [Helianthus annuus]